jgi:hypothetical protein
MQGRGEAAQDQTELVEADWSNAHRQDPALVIDPTGLRVMIDGVTVRVSDGRGLRGIALLCLIADIAWG